jgi:hypothetical protein
VSTSFGLTPARHAQLNQVLTELALWPAEDTAEASDPGVLGQAEPVSKPGPTPLVKSSKPGRPRQARSQFRTDQSQRFLRLSEQNAALAIHSKGSEPDHEIIPPPFSTVIPFNDTSSTGTERSERTPSEGDKTKMSDYRRRIISGKRGVERWADTMPSARIRYINRSFLDRGGYVFTLNLHSDSENFAGSHRKGFLAHLYDRARYELEKALGRPVSIIMTAGCGETTKRKHLHGTNSINPEEYQLAYAALCAVGGGWDGNGDALRMAPLDPLRVDRWGSYLEKNRVEVEGLITGPTMCCSQDVKALGGDLYGSAREMTNKRLKSLRALTCPALRTSYTLH